MEIWKKIENYEGKYVVSNLGNIGRIKKNGNIRLLKPQANKKGYLRVNLYYNFKMKTHRVHRIVGKTFIPNPYNLPQINHKNGNKKDNRVDNLEWVTNEENYNHAIKNNLNHFNMVKVARCDKNGNILETFESISKARKVYPNVCSFIYGNCKHKHKTTKNIYWIKL